MKLESRPQAQGPAPPASRRRLRFAFGALLLTGYTAVVFAAGLAYYKALLPVLRSLTQADTAAVALPAVVRSPANFLSARLAAPAIEHIEIDIRFKHLHRLNEKRNEAMRLGTLLKTDDDFVPAEIRHNGKKTAVKLRLKGDQPDHWRGEKRSFRIHVRNGDHLFGMRRFSIQAPLTRGYHLEPLFFAHLRREGVLAPRYAFLDVTVNGKDIGLMALEEHVSKELLESQQRREGVVFRFDESLFWEHVILTAKPGPFNNVETSFLRPFESGRIAESPALTAQWEQAAGLLRGFMNGNLSAGDVFDLELTARLMAVSEVWRSPHALTWLNRRFYFNPLSSRIEPVGFDGNIQAQYKGPGLTNLTDDFSKRLLAHPEFVEVFVRELRRISGEMADGTIQAALEPLAQEWLRIVWRETPALAPVDFEDFAELARPKAAIDADNLAHFDPTVGRPDLLLPAPVVGHLQSGPEGAFLEVTNNLPIEVAIEALHLIEGGESSGRNVVLAEPGILPLRLAPSPLAGPATRAQIAYLPPDHGGTAIQGAVRVRGQDEPYAFVARHYPNPAVAPALPRFELDALLARHSFLEHAPGSQEIRVRPGEWSVASPLQVPTGYQLAIGPGTTLRFARDAGVVSRGALRFAGTAAQPIVLAGMDDEPWQGVYVIGSPEPSHWAHVEVRNTAGFDALDSGLTGGVTFRRNRVSLEACRFLNNQAEDALNIIRSEFSLVDVVILDARSDALDADFTRGEIRGGTIARVGGDGIDMSGSTIEIHGVRLEDVYDKAVSVGEASQSVIRDIQVRRVGTVIASKDGSRVDFADSSAHTVGQVAFMAYNKKPVYGGADLIVSDVVLDESGQVALAQTGSRVVIDAVEVAPQELDTDELYRAGTMQK